MLPTVVAGALRHSLARPRDLRHELLKNAWIELKRFGAPNVINIEPSRISGLERVLVEGPVSRHCTLVLAALGVLLECGTIFEFGTYRGDKIGRASCRERVSIAVV